MSHIVLSIASSKHERVILIRFQKNEIFNEIAKNKCGARWSYELKAWVLDYTMDAVKHIQQAFSNIPSVSIDSSAVVEREQKDIVLMRIKNNVTDAQLSFMNQQIEKFVHWLRSKRYSESTIKSYKNAIKVFLMYCSKKEIHEIDNEDIIQFNNQYILANDYSASIQNQVVNAIKLFFMIIEDTQIEVQLVHRPKRAKVLPNVLSKAEIKKILNVLTNRKHQAMLSLIYSCGLRCGELLQLKPAHIDSNRMVLIIKQAKGRKDRIAPISMKTIEMLREYYKLYKPKTFLFEGATIGEPYDARSLQNVMKQAIRKAGIHKPVTLHWLRHSYATHLLEGGTDLRYIQEILGHQSSRTTEIYTHVSTKSIQHIISPFDTL
jgi:integrase/recombinase XerD